MENKKQPIRQLLNKYGGMLFFYITPLVMFLTVEILEFGDESFCMIPWNLAFWTNLMAYYGLYILVRTITRRTHLTICLMNTIFLLCGVITYYSIDIRNAPVSPWDIAAAGTAMNVLEGFDLTPPPQVILCIIGVILWMIASHRFKKAGKYSKPTGRDRLEGLATTVVLLTSFTLIATLGQANFYISTWRQVTANRQNGMLLNFVMNCGTLFNPKPTGYSQTSAEEILKTTEGTYQTDGPNEQNPNIIVIMDETFSDLTIHGDLRLTNMDDVMPFVRSLKNDDNAITGQLVVPAWGGGTCNSEFEFLTSNTYAFFQSGSYPMLQYVHKRTDSIASVLSAQGYQTIGMHPYYGSGWGRSRAYPLMGFDRFLDVEDFEDPEMLRRYISDKSSFEKIIELYEEKPEDQPLFLFNVTMQNHCSYDTKYKNFPEDVEFEHESIYPLTKQYLSLIKRSDKSLKKLIKYFKKQDEPTIVVMFGDHQPYIENAFYRYLRTGSNKSDAEFTMDQHTVPFFIWANYDIEGYDAGRISANYLGPLTLDVANLEMSPFQEYVYAQMERYPVISCVGCIDKFDIIDPLEMADLSDYRIVQYKNVFDKKAKKAAAKAAGSGSAAGSR